MEKYIIEYDKKLEMFNKCVSGLFEIYKKKKNEKISKNQISVLVDGKKALEDYQKNGDFNYSLAFFVSFSLASNYHELVNDIKSNKITMNELRNEEYWDIGNINEDISLFFAYSFLNEIFGKILSIDMYKIMNSSSVIRSYLQQRKELLNSI